MSLIFSVCPMVVSVSMFDICLCLISLCVCLCRVCICAWHSSVFVHFVRGICVVFACVWHLPVLYAWYLFVSVISLPPSLSWMSFFIYNLSVSVYIRALIGAWCATTQGTAPSSSSSSDARAFPRVIWNDVPPRMVEGLF